MQQAHAHMKDYSTMGRRGRAGKESALVSFWYLDFFNSYPPCTRSLNFSEISLIFM